ncbi:MAG: 16S rRNA (guanine(527)-N(7))-methyltransferase RsmG [Sphingomonadaceae bacterium]
MTEDAARAFVAGRVPRETFSRLERWVGLLEAENARQNLVSARSLAQVWSRHIADSAQLLDFAPEQRGDWLDLGSGAGFPGLIVALAGRHQVVLAEERRLRCDFLARSVRLLGLGNRAEVACGRVERLPARRFAAISARAFAPLETIFALGSRFAGPGTRWLLPRGRKAKSELEAARASWQGELALHPSLTDADSHILVATRVRARREGKDRP